MTEEERLKEENKRLKRRVAELERSAESAKVLSEIQRLTERIEMRSSYINMLKDDVLPKLEMDIKWQKERLRSDITPVELGSSTRLAVRSSAFMDIYVKAMGELPKRLRKRVLEAKLTAVLVERFFTVRELKEERRKVNSLREAVRRLEERQGGEEI